MGESLIQELSECGGCKEEETMGDGLEDYPQPRVKSLQENPTIRYPSSVTGS
jgi:hypothetical protein